jgi:protein SCO1/2
MADLSPPSVDTVPERPGGPAGPAIVVGLIVAFAVVLASGLVIRAALGGGSDDVSAGATLGGGSSFNGMLLDEPRPRPDFTLTDTDGNPFSFRDETAGTLTILFFGYANCPDICPITLATLDGALSMVKGVNAQVVFVTVDPQRDTPAELRSYLNRFDPGFVGLTGTPDELAAAQQAAGVTPAFDEGPNKRGGYDVAHSSQVIVFTPDDQGRLVYGFGTRQDEWVADLERVRDTPDWWVG